MSLSSGTRIGAYEVSGRIGSGGMGEVYRATDTNLKRQVAIKVLPEAVASDPDRLARFQREAEVLASLNHPNIAAIYGLERAATNAALVMELVEGPTLADRLAGGAILVDEAITIARQVAEALESAHEQGIVHRDLKPANVKLKPDGTVKVLDFGLAKAIDPGAAAASGQSMSPTITTPAMTQAGMILGTAAYMSPEQARGKPVDRRADIWAFGCVLYEMLTGRRPFAGEEVSDVLASVLAREPDVARLPPTVTPPLKRLIRRCLVKEPRQRLRDIGDAIVELDEARVAPVDRTGDVGSPVVQAWWRRTPVVGMAMLIVGVVATALVSWILQTTESPLVARFSISPPQGGSLSINTVDTDLAITPDGRRVVFPVAIEGGQRQLYVRQLEELAATPLEGLGRVPRMPFVSPDGGWIGYFDGTASIAKVSILGGPPIRIAADPGGIPRGASWGPDDRIVFATTAAGNGLWMVDAGGGEEPTPLVSPPDGSQQTYAWPEFLPGGNAVLFTIVSAPAQTHQVAVLSLETGEQKVLLQGSSARYASSGHLVYGVDAALRAVPFDLATLEVTGDPRPVLDGVSTKTSGAANFAMSVNGSLIYVPGGSAENRTLGWVDREGEMTPLLENELIYGTPRLSPDGRRVVVALVGDGRTDLWIRDLDDESSYRLTEAGGNNYVPSWSPDGTAVVFASDQNGGFDLFSRPVGLSGPEVLQLEDPDTLFAPSWTSDGRTLVYYRITDGAQRDILTLTDGESQELLATPFNEFAPHLSPDDRLLAYVSDQSDENRVYLRPFPSGDRVIWVSPGPGGEPVWSRDGRELFYRSGNQLMAVRVEGSGDVYTVGRPTVLFEETYDFDPTGPGGNSNYDVSLDGQRFLMVRSEAPEGLSLTFVQNWFEELQRLVPTN